MKPIRMLSDNMLAAPLSAETVSAGGIVLPDVAQDKRHKASRVIACGPSAGVAPGDVVVHSALAGQPYNDLLILASNEVLGIADCLKDRPLENSTI